jgi:type III restriction enzyme
MKFKFDANQGYQLDAIQAAVDLFKGQQESRSSYEISFRTETAFMGQSTIQTQLGLGNYLAVCENALQDNLSSVQKRNGIIERTEIQKQGKNFATEMETGTGKTYVYLRTLFELNKVYGYKKFIVVVPSVAIREGVLKSIAITKEHFSELYNNVPVDSFVYDSKRAANLRSFSISNQMQIMIINIDSFNKKSINIIHDERDQANGYRWLDYIRATNPIVIMDEPQNMESEKAKEAIASLNPLCTLRYSATHRDKYNLIYKLDPIKAFQMRLVKRISVNSIVAESDPAQSYLRVEGITNKGGNFKAKLAYFEQSADGPKKKSKQFKQHDDIFVASKEYEPYKNGFRIDEIDARPGMEYVKFSNGIRLSLGTEQGGNRDDIIRKQIRETIRAHFDKELQVKGMGLKVLSLFFLDKVANYRIHTKDGYELGRYAKWFEEIYAELTEEYKTLFAFEFVPAEKVHNGYFSKDKKGDLKDSTGASEDDEDTYSLIMTDKEKLLDVANPLKFIFSHSALREGWDNPNVFQICTINETASPMKKRQEIGRGLRLPVNQAGDRIWDDHVNNLVVVANESYDEFVSKLQKEFEEDCGVVFGRLPVHAFVGLQCGEKKLGADESDEIWKHLKNEAAIADDGFILPAFNESVEKQTFTVPEKYKTATNEIIRVVEQHQLSNHIEDHNKKVKVRVNEDVLLDPEFEKFWNAINTKTVYSVTYQTSVLIQKASEAVMKMPRVEAFKLKSTHVDVDVSDGGVSAILTRTPNVSYAGEARQLPDILSYVQSKVELTRSTIYEILKQSKRLNEFTVNPQAFMDMVVKEIRDVLHRMIIEGIQYEKLDEISYEMSQFRIDEHKMMFARDKIVPTKKSVYDYILYDSGVEKRFAEGLEHLRNIKYFIKLPGWFKVETPIGTYNPDWAILKENGKIVYMIRETKATKEQLQLRLPEVDKIECGRQHFIALGVDYDLATCIEDARL